MNKIYKVVWSKAKHCYVVTSELAKRQTKGCGARSLRMATVSLSVAASLLCAGAVLPIFGESVAEAGSVGVVNKLIMGDGLEWNGSTTAVTITADTIDTINNNINADPRKHAYGNITYTYGSEKFNAIAERDVVTFKVVDEQLIECHYAPITVIQQYPSAMDGYDTNKDVSGYSITINNTSDKLLYAVYGGYSKEGNVSSNSATITNGTITNTVYGGYSGVNGNVENNNVTINGGTIGDLDNGSGAVYGAYTYNGLASNNTITINSGSTVRCPTAGSSYNGKVEENTLNINGGTIVEMAFGGVGNGTYVKSNTVNIKNDATVNATVYGGMVWGDSASDPTDVTGNTVNISDTANVNENVYGGYTYYGKVSNNTVNLNGGTVSNTIRGGNSDAGTVSDNIVTINDGKVNGTIYGGSSNSGAVTNNKVTVTGGAINDIIWGGDSNGGDAKYNAVTISGDAKIVVEGIMGGRSWNSEATGNTVTISGGSFEPESQDPPFNTISITAGVSNANKLTAKDNVVNITGEVTGLDTAEISGYNYNITTHSGNELHVGGTKTYDSNGTATVSSSAAWQGKSSDGTVNNKVKSVAQFESIVLHNVKWGTTLPVLEATKITNIGTLDIKDINFDQIPSSGSMGLLKSGSDLSAIKLDHATGSGIAITTTGVDLAPVDMTETTGVNGVKLAQSVTGKVLLAADSKAINYSVAASEIKGVTFGEVTFAKNGIARDLSNRTFAATNTVDAEDLTFVATDQVIAVNDSMKLVVNATNLTTTVANNTGKTVAVTGYEDAQKIKYNATASGTVTSDGSAVLYTVDSVTLSSVDLGNWSGTTSVVPESWSIADGATIKTDGMTAPTIDPGNHIDILQSNTDKYFAAATITGANVYKETSFKEEEKGIALAGVQSKGVTLNAEKNHLIYMVGKKNVNTVTLGATNWQKGATLFDGSSATEYDYANVTAVDTGKFDVTYASPETVAAGESMTLLKANETLTAIINEEKAKAYSFSPVSGVTVDAAITGKLANSGNNVVFTAAANQASKLTFGDVEWKDSGALLTRPRNITFAGADVDTSRINFTNMIYLDADRQMTLVSDFGDKVGTITGSKYLVGTAFEGEGAASLSGSDLVFRTKTGAGVSEQTHKTVMATEVGVTMLNTGNDYIDKAMEGMGDLANVAPDGTTVGAAIGGGRNRYETGSHVNVNSWNAAVAVGAKRELKNGSLEYGVFGEYGKANFTLHSDAGKGDGDSHYAGGGLLAKWTNKHDVYTEAGFRLGRLSESSSDIMRDGLGNTYGYDVHANYFGAHVGIGKIFRYKGGKSLDVYGKYFYTKRDGVEFDAVQHYNLDSVSSSVLRVGARYGTTDKKWNWYGGLAYEYEFDGEAEGVVNGVAIRAASIKGSSVRGEIGMRMEATKTNPWQMDISLYGYGGKHRGFGGNVNVAYMF